MPQPPHQKLAFSQPSLRYIPQMVVMKEIPQQNNSSDCGMFSCKFAEYLSRRAEITFDQADMPYFRRRIIWEIVKDTLLHP